MSDQKYETRSVSYFLKWPPFAISACSDNSDQTSHDQFIQPPYLAVSFILTSEPTVNSPKLVKRSVSFHLKSKLILLPSIFDGSRQQPLLAIEAPVSKLLTNLCEGIQ